MEADPSKQFRALHAPGRLLILPNAWDAASAALVAACGAEAVATTSAGLAWSRGYPDGNALPVRVLHAAVGEIVRVIAVPLTVDIEAGYAAEPSEVGELVAAVADAGAVGVNVEDGSDAPDLLCAKIAAARRGADRAGVDVFVNARTDVYLRRLVPAEQAVAATLDRARRYREAGCDGVFVPCVAAPADIRAIAAGIGGAPLNVMAVAGLPPAAKLRDLGVRRLSAGAALAAAAYGRARRLAGDFLRDGRSEPFAEDAVGFVEMNALFARA
ncbi:MAG TPA: isocitrate lyase/phosphoenolpyruvate mutase family protein [Haliangiales bacterium]|nr:isocitrate lyase/phosphoenolpyruvate mutase family protein [Haliangiales bacterium]